MGLSFEDVMGIWAQVTDFPDGWQDHIEELLFRINELKDQEEYAGLRQRIDELQNQVLALKKDILDTVEDALEGALSQDDIESLFREYGDMLSELEQKVIELELEPEEEDESYFWGDEEEEEF